MMDERNEFSPKGLQCEFVGEAQENKQVQKDIDLGKYQLVYLSPESLPMNVAWRHWEVLCSARTQLPSLLMKLI